GQRSETKNISSHKASEKALLYEIVRQKNVLRRGKTVVQETRHFDEAREITVSLRTKEEAHDYRYFPEPDLVPLRIADLAPMIKETLPELPDAQRERFIAQYGIQEEHAKTLTAELKLATFFEEVLFKGADVMLASTWIADILKGELNYRGKTIDSFSKAHLLEILSLLEKNKITEKSGIEIVRTLLDTQNQSVSHIVKENGLLRIEGDEVIEMVKQAVEGNQDAVADYKNGKNEALNFIVGAVMKKTRGRADPKKVRELIIQQLGECNEITCQSP
ncbi:MAG: Asp-tRNA(Asn)/Glu-tRNA(Gln) amidotransferase GatCAB subunit B, partial [Methanosarcinales archaeon]|nr:Asp-tRNA(Asn)/Glu-tRNA(Gln) amidotransferase GatCAB subunit B [Candidatus Ethanoperedens thermophilum]